MEDTFEAPQEEIISIQGLLKGLDRSVITTGILYSPFAPFGRADQCQGTPDSAVVNSARWRQIFSEMEEGAVGGSDLPDYRAFVRKGEESVQGGVIPVGILNLKYHRVRDAVVAKYIVGLKKESLPEPSPDTDSHFEIVRAVAAAPLWPSTVTGEETIFEIGGEWLVSNTAQQIKAIEFDPGDGNGWRSVAPGARVTANYADTGSKSLRIRLHFADEVREARSEFEVRNLHVDQSNMNFPVQPAWFKGKKIEGHAYVWLGHGHASIVKPLICLGGFDPENSLTPQQVYNLFNAHGLLDAARGQSLDVVVLHYGDAGTYVEGNGLLAQHLILQLNDMPSKTQPSVVVGGSMGGLVGRYALAVMEHYGLDHQTEKFITIDTPHQGANIAMCAQYFLDYFGSRGEQSAADKRDRILNSTAARQMLVYHYYEDWPNQQNLQPDPERKGLEASFAEVNQYPGQKVKKYALANGAGDATGQSFAPGERLMSWHGSDLVWASPLAALPKGEPETKVYEGFKCGHWKWWAICKNSLPYDSAPGGTTNVIGAVAAAARASGYGEVELSHENSCFVPSISAVDKKDASLGDKLDGAKDTPFDEVFYPTGTNEPHASISAAGAQWLKGVLGIS